MGVGCVGMCNKAVGECPKHKPPVFNPPTQWLLGLLFPTPNDPHYDRWQTMLGVLSEERVSLTTLRPIHGDGASSEFGRPGHIRGALGIPAGFRMESGMFEPAHFRGLMEALLEVLAKRYSDLLGVFGPDLSALRTLVERMVEIGRCAENLNEPSLGIIVFYGW